MFGENFNMVVPLIVALLILWLVYRIKKRVELIVRNEIYKNFPSIKGIIDNFEQRVNFLKSSLQDLERRILELERKTKK